MKSNMQSVDAKKDNVFSRDKFPDGYYTQVVSPKHKQQERH